ncbi:YdcF family protein [Frankia sp. BMG5.23]|uniref:YdcF family protein n=1 Tax=Frankia sp. BMG5.23 TaxID=683305 RepID=UPI0004611466|nr:YdcF family protein [Frankia sp. BMG5.23]KDA44525.1 hypothetical protein BMG523Draft_00702 [Frankia sp. BMG5.23]
MSAGGLTDRDFERLAKIMTGPHGQVVTSENPADILIVFSCADAAVGREAARLYSDKLVKKIIFSGGIGKDSGGLPDLGISECVFLASVAIADGVPTEAIMLEADARNGAENAAFSLRIAADRGALRPAARVAGLAPAERSRRLYEELRFQVDSFGQHVICTAGFSSGTVDLARDEIRGELVRELRGLHRMHAGPQARIHRLEEFQPGGIYFELVERAGVAEI